MVPLHSPVVRLFFDQIACGLDYLFAALKWVALTLLSRGDCGVRLPLSFRHRSALGRPRWCRTICSCACVYMRVDPSLRFSWPPVFAFNSFNFIRHSLCFLNFQPGNWTRAEVLQGSLQFIILQFLCKIKSDFYCNLLQRHAATSYSRLYNLLNSNVCVCMSLIGNYNNQLNQFFIKRILWRVA